MEARSEPISRQHHRNQGMGKGSQWALAAVVLLGAGYAGWYYWNKEQAPAPSPAVAGVLELLAAFADFAE